MQFDPGDIVALHGFDQRMIVVAQLDERLLWVRLVTSDRADMYAFRPEDLELVERSALLAPPLPFTTVPQIPMASQNSIAA